MISKVMKIMSDKQHFVVPVLVVILGATSQDVMGQGSQPRKWSSSGGGSQAVELRLVEKMVYGASDTGSVFGKIQGITVDSRGVMHVLDSGFHCVHRYDGSGKYLGTYGSEGEGPGDFRRPFAIVAGPKGRVYVGGIGSLISVFSVDGEVVGSFKRAKETLESPVTSLACDGVGNLYVCALAVLPQQVIYKYAADDYRLLGSFGDSYAVGRDVDTRAERVFGGGYLFRTFDGELLFTQRTPPEVRIYRDDGGVQNIFDIQGTNSDLPAVVVEGDRTRYISPRVFAGKTIALPDGRFLTCKIERNKEPLTKSKDFQGWVYLELYGPMGDRQAILEFDRFVSPQWVDRDGQLYMIEHRGVEVGGAPVVVRYSLEY